MATTLQCHGLYTTLYQINTCLAPEMRSETHLQQARLH
jgi:hypothetical protein